MVNWKNCRQIRSLAIANALFDFSYHWTIYIAAMTAIKERPILFSAPMVRAILDGRKTVTRRPVKGFQIPTEDTSILEGERHRWSATAQRDPRYGFCVFGATEAECAKELEELAPCPYGRRGERLWVRETWARVGNCDPGYLTFAATYPSCLPSELENIPPATSVRWKPSIHMITKCVLGCTLFFWLPLALTIKAVIG